MVQLLKCCDKRFTRDLAATLRVSTKLKLMNDISAKLGATSSNLPSSGDIINVLKFFQSLLHGFESRTNDKLWLENHTPRLEYAELYLCLLNLIQNTHKMANQTSVCEHVLKTLHSLLIFLDHDCLEGVPLAVAWTLSYFPSNVQPSIMELMCTVIIPLVFTSKDDQESYAVDSIPAILTLVFQHVEKIEYHVWVIESFISRKKELHKDLLLLIAYGPTEARLPAACLLFHYWPETYPTTFLTTHSLKPVHYIWEAWKPLMCDRIDCPNKAGKALAMKMTVNPKIAAQHGGKPPPLYVCLDCTDALNRKDFDQFIDILLPSKQISLSCESKTCRSKNNQAVVTCWSPGCTFLTGNRAIRFCDACHTVRHSYGGKALVGIQSPGGDEPGSTLGNAALRTPSGLPATSAGRSRDIQPGTHIYQMTIPDVWDMSLELQTCMVEAVVSLVRGTFTRWRQMLLSPGGELKDVSGRPVAGLTCTGGNPPGAPTGPPGGVGGVAGTASPDMMLLGLSSNVSGNMHTVGGGSQPAVFAELTGLSSSASGTRGIANICIGLAGGNGLESDDLALLGRYTDEDYKVLAVFGVLLVGERCRPRESTNLQLLTRITAGIFNWFLDTIYTSDYEIGDLVERVKSEYILKWIQDVQRLHPESVNAVLLPHPLEHARIGSCWDTLCDRTEQVKHGLSRISSLIPYDIITFETWDFIIPYWLEAIRTEVPRNNYGELEILLKKIFDSTAGPFPFLPQKVYHFASERFVNSPVAVQDQALAWLEILTTIDVPIPMKELITMFRHGLSTYQAQLTLSRSRQSGSESRSDDSDSSEDHIKTVPVPGTREGPAGGLGHPGGLDGWGGREQVESVPRRSPNEETHPPVEECDSQTDGDVHDHEPQSASETRQLLGKKFKPLFRTSFRRARSQSHKIHLPLVRRRSSSIRELFRGKRTSGTGDNAGNGVGGANGKQDKTTRRNCLKEEEQNRKRPSNNSLTAESLNSHHEPSAKPSRRRQRRSRRGKTNEYRVTECLAQMLNIAYRQVKLQDQFGHAGYSQETAQLLLALLSDMLYVYWGCEPGELGIKDIHRMQNDTCICPPPAGAGQPAPGDCTHCLDVVTWMYYAELICQHLTPLRAPARSGVDFTVEAMARVVEFPVYVGWQTNSGQSGTETPDVASTSERTAKNSQSGPMSPTGTDLKRMPAALRVIYLLVCFLREHDYAVTAVKNLTVMTSSVHTRNTGVAEGEEDKPDERQEVQNKEAGGVEELEIRAVREPFMLQCIIECLVYLCHVGDLLNSLLVRAVSPAGATKLVRPSVSLTSAGNVLVPIQTLTGGTVGETYTASSAEVTAFVHYTVHCHLIPSLWGLLKAELSHLASWTVALLLYCLNLPGGARVFWHLVEADFSDSDWTVRFTAIERVTVLLRELDPLVLTGGFSGAAGVKITNLQTGSNSLSGSSVVNLFGRPTGTGGQGRSRGPGRFVPGKYGPSGGGGGAGRAAGHGVLASGGAASLDTGAGRISTNLILLGNTNPLVRAGIAHTFCSLIGCLDDPKSIIAEYAAMQLASLNSAALSFQFDVVTADRCLILQRMHQLSCTIPNKPVFTWDFFVDRFGLLALQAQIVKTGQQDIESVIDLNGHHRNSQNFQDQFQRACFAIGKAKCIKSIHQTSQAFALRFTSSKREVNQFLSPSVPRVETPVDADPLSTSNQKSSAIPAMSTSPMPTCIAEDQPRFHPSRRLRMPMASFSGSAAGNQVEIEFMNSNIKFLSSVRVALDHDSVSDRDTLHQWVRLLLKFMATVPLGWQSECAQAAGDGTGLRGFPAASSVGGLAGKQAGPGTTRDELKDRKAFNKVLRHLVFLLGYSDGAFNVPPNKMRSSTSFHSFLANIASVLDRNFAMGTTILNQTLVILQYCASPQRYATDTQPPNFSLRLLEPQCRLHWLQTLLVILYKEQQLADVHPTTYHYVPTLRSQYEYNTPEGATSGGQFTSGGGGQTGLATTAHGGNPVNVIQNIAHVEGSRTGATGTATGGGNRHGSGSVLTSVTRVHRTSSETGPYRVNGEMGGRAVDTTGPVAHPGFPQCAIPPALGPQYQYLSGPAGEDIRLPNGGVKAVVEYLIQIVLNTLDAHVHVCRSRPDDELQEPLSMPIRLREVSNVSAEFGTLSEKELPEELDPSQGTNDQSGDEVVMPGVTVTKACAEPTDENEVGHLCEQGDCHNPTASEMLGASGTVPLHRTKQMSQLLDEKTPKDLVCGRRYMGRSSPDGGFRTRRLSTVDLTMTSEHQRKRDILKSMGDPPMGVTLDEQAIHAPILSDTIEMMNMQVEHSSEEGSSRDPVTNLERVDSSPRKTDCAVVDSKPMKKVGLRFYRKHVLDNRTERNMDDGKSLLHSPDSIEVSHLRPEDMEKSTASPLEVNRHSLVPAIRLSNEDPISSTKGNSDSATEEHQVQSVTTGFTSKTKTQPTSPLVASKSRNGKRTSREQTMPSSGGATSQPPAGAGLAPSVAAAAANAALTLERCVWCDQQLERYDEATLGLGVLCLSTFVHREPSLAAPYLRDMLLVAARLANATFYSWQHRLAHIIVPGNVASIARQFLRCTMYNLAPNGLFLQLFQTPISDDNFFRCIVSVLVDFEENMSFFQPIVLLTEALNKRKNLPVDTLPVLLENLATYLECLPNLTDDPKMNHFIASGWTDIIGPLEVLLRKLPNVTPVPRNLATVVRIMTYILRSPIAYNFKTLPDTFSALLRTIVEKVHFRLSNVIELCSLSNRTLKERTKIQMSKTLVEMFHQAIKFRVFLPDENIMKLLQFILMDAGGTIEPNQVVEGITTLFNPQTCHIFSTGAAELMRPHLADCLAFISDVHTIHKVKQAQKSAVQLNMSDCNWQAGGFTGGSTSGNASAAAATASFMTGVSGAGGLLGSGGLGASAGLSANPVATGGAGGQTAGVGSLPSLHEDVLGAHLKSGLAQFVSLELSRLSQVNDQDVLPLLASGLLSDVRPAKGAYSKLTGASQKWRTMTTTIQPNTPGSGNSAANISGTTDITTSNKPTRYSVCTSSSSHVERSPEPTVIVIEPSPSASPEITRDGSIFDAEVNFKSTRSNSASPTPSGASQTPSSMGSISNARTANLNLSPASLNSAHPSFTTSTTSVSSSGPVSATRPVYPGCQFRPTGHVTLAPATSADAAVLHHLPWLKSIPPSSQLGPRDFLTMVERVRTLSWILLGATMNMALTREATGVACRPIPFNMIRVVADLVKALLGSFPDQQKQSVTVMSSLYHVFLLCQVWTVYCETAANLAPANSPQHKIAIATAVDFWTRIMPTVLRLLSIAGDFVIVSGRLLSVIEELIECRCSVVTKLFPLWIPMLCGRHRQLPGNMLKRLQKCIEWEPPEPYTRLLLLLSLSDLDWPPAADQPKKKISTSSTTTNTTTAFNQLSGSSGATGASLLACRANTLMGCNPMMSGATTNRGGPPEEGIPTTGSVQCGGHALASSMPCSGDTSAAGVGTGSEAMGADLLTSRLVAWLKKHIFVLGRNEDQHSTATHIFVH